MAGSGHEHEALIASVSRRGFLQRAGTLGLGALIASAGPVARQLASPAVARADTSPPDATLQAFADTMIPGRKASRTDLGNEIDPRAIAGVDSLPGAVEADALALYHHPEIGFDALEPAFLAELSTRSLTRGGQFLDLSFDRRVAVCRDGFDPSNPTVQVWEAAAAVPFAAFLCSAMQPNATIDTSSSYQVMGHPGTAPQGYADYSYRRKLSRERTDVGYLP